MKNVMYALKSFVSFVNPIIFLFSWNIFIIWWVLPSISPTENATIAPLPPIVSPMIYITNKYANVSMWWYLYFWIFGKMFDQKKPPMMPINKDAANIFKTDDIMKPMLATWALLTIASIKTNAMIMTSG